MIAQRAHNSKNQRNSHIEVVTCWQYIEEVSPAFKRLMSSLLQKGNERKKEVADD